MGTMNHVIPATIMPPIDGTAIGRITSLPRPAVRKMGKSARIVVTLVMSAGRMRFWPASRTAARTSATVRGFWRSDHLLDVGPDDDAVVRGDAHEGDEPDPDGDGQVGAVEAEHDEATGDRHRDAQEDDERGPQAPEVQEVQEQVDQQHERNEEGEPLRGAHLVLVPPAPVPVDPFGDHELAALDLLAQDAVGVLDEAHLVAALRR